MIDRYIAAFALLFAGLLGAFAAYVTFEKRNADLVKIGVSILRVDPEKEKQIGAAREWALDLIDANSGVRFSAQVRAELLKKPLSGVSDAFAVPDAFAEPNIFAPEKPK